MAKTDMKRICTLLVAIIAAAATVNAQDIVYEKSDSLFIAKVLEKHHTIPCMEKLLVSIANEFCGAAYTGGTLDAHDGEPLFISCSQLDCTTFAELTLAIAAACSDGEPSFGSVCGLLERIRYRNGVRGGYDSRLHYISWWIDDSAKKGWIEEVKTRQHTAVQELHLDFMSRNAHKYPMLKGNEELTGAIAGYEKPYIGKRIEYIPKEKLYMTQEALEIRNGDMLALVTSVNGLDVSHVGFAVWKNGKLHMLHASSAAGKVINDPVPLHEYMKKRKSQLGVRIFRMSGWPAREKQNKKENQ